MAVNIILIILCLVFSGLFSSAEMAFSTVNKIRLKNYASQGNKRAEKALEIATKFDNALMAILIGNNVVNTASASIGTILFTEIFGSGGVGVATMVMTVLVLIFGEILPKSLAKENAESLALTFAVPLSFVIKLFTPIIWIFTKIKDGTMKIFVKSTEEQPSVTEDELKYIIDEIEEQGVLEEQEGDLVRSALEFDEITVGEILIPRVNVVGIEINADIDEIKQTFMAEMYSRLPVYEKSLDNIVGIITQKDFFRLILNNDINENSFEIKDIMQDVIHISELKLISEAMKDMQKSKTHMAVVMDQYGGTAGIITLEDIIEELVGEIYDENDEVVTELQKVGENTYDVSGEMNIDDMLEQLGLPEDSIESSSNSVGGWVMELLGHIPVADERAVSGSFHIKVLCVQEQKIQKVRIFIDNFK